MIIARRRRMVDRGAVRAHSGSVLCFCFVCRERKKKQPEQQCYSDRALLYSIIHISSFIKRILKGNYQLTEIESGAIIVIDCRHRFLI